MNETLHHILSIGDGRFTVFIGTTAEALSDCERRADWNEPAKLVSSFKTATDCNIKLFKLLKV